MAREDIRVERTVLADGKVVSTVRLPIDHGWGGTPLWYETMVFPNEDDYGDLDCDRYTTREQAEAGHRAMVEKWADGGV